MTPAMAAHLERLNAWRALPPEEQLARMAARQPRPPDADARLAMAAELCPAGSGSCGCGAIPRDCGRPERPAKVFRATCLACVAVSRWEAGVEAGW